MDGATDARPSGDSNTEDEAATPSGDQEDAVIDISRKDWEVALFQPRSRSLSGDGLYVYQNRFSLVPRSVGKLRWLRTLKFFSNEIDVLPPEAGDLVGLERLQVKVSAPGLGFCFEKLKFLKELELCRVPPRASAFSMLGKIGSLQCLTKLSICHFSIRNLPPEIGYLKRLEELDLSFNKLKNLPNDICELDALKSLSVANNKLAALPSGISSLKRLENLDLSNNRLTSLTQIKLAAMHALQHLNLKYNKLQYPFQIPSWICCKLEGNDEDIFEDEMDQSFVEVNVSSMVVHRAHGNHSCNGCHSISPSYHPDRSSSCRCSLAQRMKKGWKRRDNLQQRARQERLNFSRKWRVEDQGNMIVKLDNQYDSCKSTIPGKGCFQVELHNEDKGLSDHSTVNAVSQYIDGLGSMTGGNNLQNSPDCDDNFRKGLNNVSDGDESSCITESSSSNKENDYESESTSNSLQVCTQNRLKGHSDTSSEAVRSVVKSKRHCDRDLDNPKPSKFRRPVDDCSSLSCKYSSDSFCSIHDRLPDGFYDAGRDRPFMSLEEYEKSLSLSSREVILLDRDRDEELDAIAISAQMFLSKFKRYCSGDGDSDEVDNLQRASILALYVSDCFGGSDRSASVIKLRKSVFGANKQQPFICTCWTGNLHDEGEVSRPQFGMAGSFNFNELCETSLRSIKAARNSNVVPIGSLRFGVCRHRAVLMKYLCDRADPPIPCELVRGYLDFMPHAWNAVHVKKGDLWVRMVVDACNPTDIRDEMDREYYCRYIPLSRVHPPLATDSSSLFECCFSSLLHSNQANKAESRSVLHGKFGTLDAAVKVRKLELCTASQDDMQNFEYSFLGEVRMMGALRKHKCIVEFYGHQLSSKWVPAVDGATENRFLLSVIVMEYMKGGSLKVYLEKLFERGEKHTPVDIAICIARDVACALVELHSKNIIHRDIKSENILIDLDCKRSDGTPIIKLADFDRSVPLQSRVHTCCNAHLGVHPPDVCVGTPRWMAPEVVQAMHQRSPYGLEVDIWSYGCLLYELLTLHIPYNGQSEAEIYSLLQMKRRPKLTPELEALALFDRIEDEFDDDVDVLKLLVDLFYECTAGDPADRPTAEYIYDKLCDFSKQPDEAQIGSNSSSSSCVSS